MGACRKRLAIVRFEGTPTLMDCTPPQEGTSHAPDPKRILSQRNNWRLRETGLSSRLAAGGRQTASYFPLRQNPLLIGTVVPVHFRRGRCKNMLETSTSTRSMYGIRGARRRRRLQFFPAVAARDLRGRPCVSFGLFHNVAPHCMQEDERGDIRAHRVALSHERTARNLTRVSSAHSVRSGEEGEICTQEEECKAKLLVQKTQP